MANSVKALRPETLVRQSRKDKAARRKARHIANKQGRTMERVCDSSSASLIRTGTVSVGSQIEKLYRQAVLDMDARLTLKGKDRRKLNNAEFAVSDAPAGDFFKEQPTAPTKFKRPNTDRKPTEGHYAAAAILKQRAAQGL